MAFRSQRYHLSRGRAKKKIETWRGSRTVVVVGRKNEKCTGVCTVAEAATRDGIGMYFMRGLAAALISLILNILWDASGIK